MIELQSLRLMDRDQTDAIDHIALDCLATERLIPFIQERVDVRRVLIDKRCQLVIEGTDIGTLILERLQLEDGIETLCEIIERQRQQFFCLMDVILGQQLVEVATSQQ